MRCYCRLDLVEASKVAVQPSQPDRNRTALTGRLLVGKAYGPTLSGDGNALPPLPCLALLTHPNLSCVSSQ